MQHFFALQMKGSVLNQYIFNQCNGIADGAFGNAEVESKMCHRSIFSPILQGEKQLVADGEFCFFASSFSSSFFSCGGQDGVHLEKDSFFNPEEFFEFCVIFGNMGIPMTQVVPPYRGLWLQFSLPKYYMWGLLG